MQKPEGVVSRVAIAVKPELIDSKANRYGSHYVDMQVFALVEEVQHLLSEDFSSIIFRPLIG